jgi:hypothetical protein
MTVMEINAKSSKKRRHDNTIPDSPRKRQKRTHTYSRSISSIGGKYSVSYRGMHPIQITDGAPDKKSPVSGTFGVRFDDNAENRRDNYISELPMLRTVVETEFFSDEESDSTSEATVDSGDVSMENDTAEPGSSPSQLILPLPDMQYVESEGDKEDWGGLNRELPAESIHHSAYDIYGILPQTINPKWAAGW